MQINEMKMTSINRSEGIQLALAVMKK